MATPIRRHVCIPRKPVRDTVINLFLVLAVGIRLADTLGDDFGVTFFMTRIATIFALIPFASEKEFLAQGAHDGLVELLLNKLMPIHFENVALALADSALTVERFVRASSTCHRVLDWG